MPVLIEFFCRGCAVVMPRVDMRHGRPKVWCSPECKAKARKDGTSICTRCGESKSSDEFALSSKNKSGLQHWCRVCASKYHKDRIDLTRKLSRKSRYGISIEEQDALWELQGGLCAGCSEPMDDVGHQSHLDHNHRTGAVRGFLCHNCNGTLGQAQDDVNRLTGLALYLIATGDS